MLVTELLLLCELLAVCQKMEFWVHVAAMCIICKYMYYILVYLILCMVIGKKILSNQCSLVLLFVVIHQLGKENKLPATYLLSTLPAAT